MEDFNKVVGKHIGQITVAQAKAYLKAESYVEPRDIDTSKVGVFFNYVCEDEPRYHLIYLMEGKKAAFVNRNISNLITEDVTQLMQDIQAFIDEVAKKMKQPDDFQVGDFEVKYFVNPTNRGYWVGVAEIFLNKEGEDHVLAGIVTVENKQFSVTFERPFSEEIAMDAKDLLDISKILDQIKEDVQ